DVFARLQVQVDGAVGRRHVEGDVVVLGQDGQAVGADLVGHVALGGDAVRAHDDHLDLARLHQRGGRAVGDEGVGDLGVLQLEGRQTGALQVGPGLVGEDVD